MKLSRKGALGASRRLRRKAITSSDLMHDPTNRFIQHVHAIIQGEMRFAG